MYVIRDQFDIVLSMLIGTVLTILANPSYLLEATDDIVSVYSF